MAKQDDHKKVLAILLGVTNKLSLQDLEKLYYQKIIDGELQLGEGSPYLENTDAHVLDENDTIDGGSYT